MTIWANYRALIWYRHENIPISTKLGQIQYGNRTIILLYYYYFVGESFGESGSAGSLDTSSCKSTGVDHYSSSSDPENSTNQFDGSSVSVGESGDRTGFLELMATITRVEMDREPGGKQFAVYVVKVTNAASSWEVTR